MKRFFGMMPANEVLIQRRFRDMNGHTLLIQAGRKGWSIMYADNSSEYGDADESPEANFETAYRRAMDAVGPLTYS